MTLCVYLPDTPQETRGTQRDHRNHGNQMPASKLQKPQRGPRDRRLDLYRFRAACSRICTRNRLLLQTLHRRNNGRPRGSGCSIRMPQTNPIINPDLAGCGKSRDFGKTVMKRARNGSPGLIKSTGYEGAKGDESGWKHHRPTFSAAC